MSSIQNITVVAAVIRDEAGRVLLTRRPAHKHMGGLWEFPGGKIDDGESPATALIRELHEELGVEASIDEPLTFAVHEEAELRILLLFYSARVLERHPVGREGQDVRWVDPSDLSDYSFPPADAELVARLAEGAVP
jgi:8-oxo-dGTP diphosphatase